MTTLELDWMEMAALEGVVHKALKDGVEGELLKQVLTDIWAKIATSLEEEEIAV